LVVTVRRKRSQRVQQSVKLMFVAMWVDDMRLSAWAVRERFMIGRYSAGDCPFSSSLTVGRSGVR
jgi:hypothetical protein